MCFVELLEQRRLLSGITTLVSFNGADGALPACGVVLSGDTLYGGAGDTVFAVPATGGTPTTLATVAGVVTGVILSGGTLYGTTLYGGDLTQNGGAGDGTVFAVPATGGTPTVLASFNGADGDNPYDLVISGNTLYGAAAGGPNNGGVVFAIPTTGGTPTVLASFDDTDLSLGMLSGSLIVSGSTLYGTATFNVFSLPTAGGTPTGLSSGFTGEGVSGMILSGTTFYGLDGDNVFSLPMTGGAPTMLTSVTSFSAFGGVPNGLTLSGDTLYGTAFEMTDSRPPGPRNAGSVFSLPVSGGTPLVLAFTGGDGESPSSILVADAAGNLYGTTVLGGAGDGTVFELTPGAPGAFTPDTNQLAFTDNPSNAATGSTLGTITVHVEDSNGNLLTSDNSDVTLGITGGRVTLAGTTTVRAVNGVATFSNLSINTPNADYTLTATDGDYYLADSSDFSISAPAPDRVAFFQQPSSAAPNSNLGTVTVDVEDSSGNRLTGDTSNVTLAISNNASGATLGGAATVAAVNGVATFNDLSISATGDNYTLTATDGSDTPATSTPFNIVAATPPSPLVPTLGNVSLPSAVVAGSTLKAKVPVVVTNTGGNFKGTITVNIYAELGTALPPNQMPIVSLTKNVSLKAGQGKAFDFNIKSLPPTLADGTYHLLAEVVDPSDKTNVVATAQTVTVAAAFIKPSVSVGTVSPSSIAAGKSASILVTVTNSGNVPASDVNITLSPSTDGVTPLAGITLASTHSGTRILPGKSKTFKLHFKASSALAAGSYLPYISVILGGTSTTAAGTASFTVE